MHDMSIGSHDHCRQVESFLRNLLPGVNAGSLVWSLAPGGGASGEAPPGVVDAVTGGRATLSLAVYVAAFIALGALLVRRRDVT